MYTGINGRYRISYVVSYVRAVSIIGVLQIMIQRLESLRINPYATQGVQKRRVIYERQKKKKHSKRVDRVPIEECFHSN